MNMEDIWELPGLIQLYQATGEAGYGRRALEWIDSRSGREGDKSLFSGKEASAYLFALEQTGKQEYRQAADMVFSRLESGEEEMSELAMPFYAEYDTLFRQKAHYEEITVFFEKKETWTGRDAAALIDTIGKMSMEIYEYYRALCDLFKAVIRSEMYPEIQISGMENSKLPPSGGEAEAGYAVLKACNLGVLNSEKYGPAGAGIWKRFGAQQDNGAGIGKILKAQYLIFERNSD